jgi:tellurite resistance protein TehA-like permease
MTGGRFTELELPPDVFAVVMATGIVSVAADDHGYWRLGIALSVLAAAAFAGLGVGFLLLAATRRARAIVRTRNPDVALRMFAFVAACAVLDVRWGDHPAAGWLLGGLALVAWLVLVPLATVDVASRPSADLREHAHGAWLLPSVATAGLATIASTLAIDVRLPALVVVAALAWVLAMVFYLLVTWLIAWRPGSLRYQGVWWAAVFPLGMYSAASAATATQLHMRSLATISLVFFWIAFTVWTLVAIGLLHCAVGRRAEVGAGSAGPAPDT